MAVFKSLTFDGINSLDYGIYVTGEAVYNAPERAVEMVTIPGRNGALAIDQGYFENIEVSYPCGCFAETQAEFASKVSAFRNAIGSRYSYKRLTDEYNADEYRLGLYKSGLEVSAVRYGTAGQFTITFDCKPQRFLLDGDAELSPTDYSDVHTVSGDIVQIENDGSLGVKSLTASLEPIQSGSGTPSPDNVRPISGHTEVVTQRTGKNLFNEQYPNIDGSMRRVYVQTGNGTFTLSTTTQAVDGSANLFFQAGQATSGESTGGNGVYSGRPRTVTTTDGYVTISYRLVNNTTDAGNPTKCKTQLENGSTPTTYEPYNGNTYTTDLGRTVYGGTLDVVSGVLTVDRAVVEYDGSENWGVETGAQYTGANFFVAKPSGVGNDFSVFQSNATNKFVPSLSTAQDGICVSAGYFNCVFGNFLGISTVAEFKTWLSAHNLQIVYPLSTPQTYQLTPQEVELLLGTNNLWTDCGDSTVEYGIPPYYNPTEFDAKPLIKVTGRGTLGIGEYILTITGTASQTLYIDCETMEIYKLEGTVPTGASSLVSINKADFPVLKPGQNGVSVGSGLSALTITPRWWRI